MSDTPDWVLIEAAKQAGIKRTPAQIRAGQMSKASKPVFRALCDMIAKHEEPPVERKVLCAREAVRESNATRSSMMALAIRAIELWEEGFGA